MEENIPQKDEDIIEPENALPPVTLKELPEVLQKAAARAGWVELADVQAKTIPYFRARRDLMVQARTGSGKTGAFLLPIMERINFKKNACQALVIVPTRELAQQVSKEALLLAGEDGMRTAAVYGGTGYGKQIDAFKKGAHLVVGTPGRILDHLLKRNLNLKDLEILIFDEADRMLSMGFYPDMVHLKEFLPEKKRSTFMFSATFPGFVKMMAFQFMHKPDFMSLSEDHVHVENTEHIYYVAPGMDKDRSLVRIIEMENPTQAIIFCNTKDRVFYITRVLQRFGYNADQLSSDLSQNVRDKVLNRVREGKIRFLVATDVAARGIDIPHLSHVIQYEPPDDLEAYIHRAGRTGRAGDSGEAILLVNLNETRQLTRIAAHYKINFTERPLPKDEDVQNLVAQRLIGQLEARLRSRDKLQNERMRRFETLAKQLAEEEHGLSLLTMLLDDTYHEWMHKPPELPPVGTKAAADKSKQKSHREGRKRGGHKSGSRPQNKRQQNKRQQKDQKKN